MKYRYYVFACDTYYPCGGMEDCIYRTNDLVCAIIEADNADEEWAIVYDFKEDQQVHSKD
jgi:hypothetical protein